MFNISSSRHTLPEGVSVHPWRLTLMGAMVVAAVMSGCAADAAAPGEQAGDHYGESAYALTALSKSPLNNQAGFPTWYADVNAVAVEQCLDPLDPHCVVLPNPGVYDTGLPQIFPSNYPDEAFYFIADSEPITTGQCGNVGSILARFAVEAAFSNGQPIQGDQMVFGRLRVTGDGLCPNHSYLFKHPYGTVTLTTDDRGRIRPKNANATTDVGCVPGPGAPCDFSLALGSTVMQNGLLRWDPAVAPAADPGYLGGDAAMLHSVTGGIGGVNYVSISETDGTELYRTDLFTVAGKLANPLTTSADAIDMGQVMTGSLETRTLTVTNNAAVAIPVQAVTLRQPGTDWSMTSTCTDATLAPAATCTVSVAFTGSATLGTSSATLTLVNGATGAKIDVPLRATSIVPTIPPSLTVQTANLASAAMYSRIKIGTSRPILVTIRNNGPGAFDVQSLAPADAVAGSGDAAAFAVTSDCPVGGQLLAGQTCLATLTFAPTQHMPYAASLVVAGLFGTTPATFALPASGRGGIAASSASTTGLGIDGFPLWYQDDGEAAIPTAPAIRVTQCLDAADPYCIVLPDATFDPALPVVFPSNYPGEAFYFIADADRLPLSACGGTGALRWRAALEQTFATGSPTAGDQMTFARVRFSVSGGLCPNTTYTLTHPYGVATLVSDAAGSLAVKNGTTDVGCVPTPAQPCNFDIATETALSDHYLLWDTTLPEPPAGYLGDPAVLHTVLGSPFGTNFVSIKDAATGVVIAEGNQFLVAGKKAIGPQLTAAATALNLGTVSTVAPGEAVSGVVQFTNTGVVAANMSSVATTGAGFAVSASTCGAVLVPGASCDVTVTLTGAAPAGARTGTLTVLSDAAPVTVSLSGVAVDPVLVTTTTLEFGTVSTSAPDNSASRTATIANPGPVPVGLGAFSVTGDGFALTANTCPAVLAPAASCTATLTLTGASPAGARTGTLSVASTAPTVTTSLTGNVVAPVLAQGASSLALANVSTAAPGNVSTANVTISNPGPVDATITAITALGTGFAVQSTSCGALLLPAATCTVTVSLTGDASAGLRTGTLTITGDAPTLTVALTGSVIAPSLTASTTSLTFGDVLTAAPGNTSVRSVTISNPGSVTAGISLLTVTGTGYTITANTCPANLAPAGTCSASVTLTGSAPTGARSGTLTITGTAAPLNIALAGNAVAAQLTTSAASLNFGAVLAAAPNNTAARTLTVTNPGAVATGLSAFAVSGTGYTISGNTCGTLLAAGASCTVTTTLTGALPLGARTGALTITSSAGTFSIALTGQVAVPVLAVTPLTLNFGSIAVNTTSAAKTLTVSNSGPNSAAFGLLVTAPLVGKTTTVGRFQVTVPAACGKAMYGALTCTISVKFAPNAVGTSTSSVTVASNSGGSQVVTLTGTGAATPQATLSVATLSLGARQIGTVTFTNSGLAPVVMGTPTAAISGTNASLFAVTANTCPASGASLAVGAKCTVSVQYTRPAGLAKAVNHKGTLTINSNAGAKTVALAGHG